MYSKVFVQILDSSIAEDYVIRHVFMDFLILADRNGVVDMTPEAIARRTNVPIEIISRSIEQLMKPDPRSRSHEEAGARLVLLDSNRDWGWQIVNYSHYRNIRSDEERREADRLRQQRYRTNKGTDGSTQAEIVTDCHASSRESRHAVSSKQNAVSSKQDKSSPRSVPPEEQAGTLPLVDGTDFPISKTQIQDWSEAYPGIDVLAELKKAREWLKANPRKRKTPAGMNRFAVNWLDRAQNKHGGRDGFHQGTVQPDKHEQARRNITDLYGAGPEENRVGAA